jgi:multiple sugar transport system ATP-binding protein
MVTSFTTIRASRSTLAPERFGGHVRTRDSSGDTGRIGVMAWITFQHVSKRYRDAIGVEDLDLRIRDGEIFVIIGPSGCGKTTALRLIAGLELPDSGTILFDGEDMTEVAPAERDIAMVFEGFALYPHWAIRQNLEFALKLRKVPRKETERRVADVAGAMGLGHLLGRKPGSLATGEAQSVAVGRAVVREEPSVLLLDDALAHLDARQRLEARSEVRRVHRELGCTIVSVTHDQAEALAVGDRVAVLDAGVLQQVGTPRELYEEPANVFVAGFIGEPAMNLVPMRREQVNGHDVLRADGVELPAPATPGSPAGEFIVGFRADDVRLAAEPAADEGRMRGRCELVEYLGSELLVHLRVGGDEIVLRDDSDDDIDVGDTVACAIRADRLRLFDPATGAALARSLPDRT